MPSKRFEISYPDGSKKKVSGADREQMLLAGEIRQVSENCFRYIGQVKTYHSFSDLAELRERMEQPPNLLRRFLPGQFVIEYPRRLGGKRVKELLQTPEAMTLQLAGANEMRLA